jgi:cytidylate kinase
MIITIDGPAGAGKSSAARGLARRLGFEFLDTGAMFRAVALALLLRRLDPSDDPALRRVLAGLRLELEPGRVLLDGEDVTGLIRTPEVSSMASQVAVLPAVRWELAERQRRIARGRDIVCEGRDQGTAVFPYAECKFFLKADPVERARRRQREYAARGEDVSLDDVLKAQEERDRRDAGRALAPLRAAADAVEIDTTYLSPDEVLALLEQKVKQCRTGSRTCGISSPPAVPSPD